MGEPCDTTPDLWCPPRTPSSSSSSADSADSGNAVVPADMKSKKKKTDGSKKRDYTLQMDLAVLRQIRAYPANPFTRGSDAFEEASKVLAASGDPGFQGLAKKGARDRMMTLLDHHAAGDAWKKRQSGAAEEYTEKDQLLTELAQLYNEKEFAQERSAQAAEKGRERAAKLRDDACQTLSQKKMDKEEGTANRRSSGNFMKPIVEYMQNKAEQQGDSKKLELERERLQFEQKRHADEVAMRREEQETVRRERERREKIEDEERKIRYEKEKEERDARREERQQMREQHQMMMTSMQAMLQQSKK